MRKCANSSPYMGRPSIIYDFPTAPFWIYLYMRKIWFSFLSVYSVSLFCSPFISFFAPSFLASFLLFAPAPHPWKQFLKENLRAIQNRSLFHSPFNGGLIYVPYRIGPLFYWPFKGGWFMCHTEQVFVLMGGWFMCHTKQVFVLLTF